MLTTIKKQNQQNNNNGGTIIYNNNNGGTVIWLWIALTQWMSRSELRLSTTLWVNICLENAVN